MNLITTREAAEILEMHSNSVMYHAKQGNLVGHKVFNEWRFESEEVYKFFSHLADQDRRKESSYENKKGGREGRV
jgi:hypothetical protein